MPIAIEREPRPRRPAVPHSPYHCQAAHLIEPITGINEHSPARLYILSEELKDSQCPLSPLTPFLALDFPVLFHLHPKCGLKSVCRLLLRSRRLYS